MVRSVGILLALGLLAGQAQEAYTIKVKESSAGDVVQVDEQSTEQAHVKVIDAAGKVLHDQTEKKGKNYSFQESILERPDPQKRPTRLKRQYTKAEQSKDGKARTLAYQGQTVLIEKKDGKYRFQVEGGKELTGDDAQELDTEFNKDKAGDLDLRKLLLPSKPVRVNETWKIDPVPLVKELAKGDALGVDAAKATATGKLVEVYKKDGQQHGKMEFTLDIPLKEFIQGPQKLALEPGARLAVTFLADLCIDGGALTGTIKGNVNMTATANLPTPDGGKGKLTVDTKVTGQEQRKELPRK